MIEGFTELRKCRRCNGAFYGSASIHEWTFDFCDDCWETAADEWNAKETALQFNRPIAYICYDLWMAP